MSVASDFAEVIRVSKSYEENGDGHYMNANHLTLITCFISYVKWVDS